MVNLALALNTGFFKVFLGLGDRLEVPGNSCACARHGFVPPGWPTFSLIGLFWFVAFLVRQKGAPGELPEQAKSCPKRPGSLQSDPWTPPH